MAFNITQRFSIENSQKLHGSKKGRPILMITMMTSTKQGNAKGAECLVYELCERVEKHCYICYF